MSLIISRFLLKYGILETPAHHKHQGLRPPSRAQAEATPMVVFQKLGMGGVWSWMGRGLVTLLMGGGRAENNK